MKRRIIIVDYSKFIPVKLGITIDDLHLGMRASKIIAAISLEIGGLEYLVQKTESEIRRCKGFGGKCMLELKAGLAKHGLCLGMRYEQLHSISVLGLPTEIEEILREKAGIVRIHQLLDKKRSDLKDYLDVNQIDLLADFIDFLLEPPEPVVVINPIQDLGLDWKINKVLINRGIVSINQLIEMTEDQLWGGFVSYSPRTHSGHMSEPRIFQIESALVRRGLTLKDSRFVRMLNTLTEASKVLSVAK